MLQVITLRFILSVDGVCTGFTAITDEIKPGSREIFALLHTLGIQSAMLPVITGIDEGKAKLYFIKIFNPGWLTIQGLFIGA